MKIFVDYQAIYFEVNGLFDIFAPIITG